MDFFTQYQEITPEQFHKLTLTHETQTKHSKKYVTMLNGRKYFVLSYKEKFFISRQPIRIDINKWMPIESFKQEGFKKEEIEKLTSTGSKMFTLTKDEVQYVGIITDEGEFVSKENKIIF